MENNLLISNNTNNLLPTQLTPDKISEYKKQTDSILNLLIEFYTQDNCTIDRHKEIEAQLLQIKNSIDYLEFFLYDLDNFTNELTWMFKISCLEHHVTRKLATDRNLSKNVEHTLWNIYKNLSVRNSEKMLRDKLAQLIVYLYMQNFNFDTYSNYFLEELQLLLNDKFLLGITLLNTISQELFSSRSFVSVQHRQIIKLWLEKHLQPIYEILQSSMACLCNTMTQEINVKTQEIVILKTSLNKKFYQTTIEFLLCIQNLLSWSELKHYMTEVFIENLFNLATLKFTLQPDTSIAALTTICEIFYSHIVLSVPQQTAIVKNIIKLLDDSNLIESEISYLEKINELLTLFSAQSYCKWFNEETFNFYIYRVFNYTMNTKYLCDQSDYTDKLSVWKSLIKTHMMKDYQKYEGISTQLVGFILNQLFLSSGSSQTELLDNILLDDDMNTDWQRFTGPYIELILLLTQMQPVYCIKNFMDFYEFFIGRLFVALNDQQPQNPNSEQVEAVSKLFRDMSTLFQILSALPLIVEEPYPIELYKNMLLKYDRSLILVHATIPEKHRVEADNFYANLLSVGKSFVSIWEKNCLLDNNYVQNLINVSLNCIVKPNFSSLVQYESAQLFLVISSVIRKKTLLSNDLVRSFFNTSYNLEDMSIKIRDKSAKTRNEFYPVVIFQGLCNILLLPWLDVPEKEQMNDERNYLFQMLMHQFINDYLVIDMSYENEKRVNSAAAKCLPIITEILNHFYDSPNYVKIKLTIVYQPILMKSITVLNTFNNLSSEAFECIIDFIKCVIRSLQNQFSAEFIQDLLQIIFSVTSKIGNFNDQLNLIDKILQILMYIVERPGAVSKIIFPYAIRFVLDQVFPLIKDEQRAQLMDSVVVSMVQLLDCILQNKWNHFYPSQVHSKPLVLNNIINHHSNNNGYNNHSGNVPPEIIQNEKDFNTIFYAYGILLLSWNDLEVKLIILNSLQKVNDKFKLFSREYFHKNLLFDFINTFMKIILLCGISIHDEIIINMLYSMGQVDKELLKKSFIENGFLNNDIVEKILHATDLPTFAENMNLFITDMKKFGINQN